MCLGERFHYSSGMYAVTVGDHDRTSTEGPEQTIDVKNVIIVSSIYAFLQHQTRFAYIFHIDFRENIFFYF